MKIGQDIKSYLMPPPKHMDSSIYVGNCVHVTGAEVRKEMISLIAWIPVRL